MISFFRISYCFGRVPHSVRKCHLFSLLEKKKKTYCTFPSFSLIEKCYQDNQQRFISTIRNQYWNFGFFHKVFFKNTKNAPIFTIFVGYGWLTNSTLIFDSDKVCQSSIQFDNSIERYQVYDLLKGFPIRVIYFEIEKKH